MYIFKDTNDAVKRLTKHSAKFSLPFRRNLRTPKDIIEFSVNQNIFRALPLRDQKPSVVYRQWAASNFSSMHDSLRVCESQREFMQLVKYYTESFLSAWLEATNQKLVYGPASKIVNLLIKAVQESEEYRIGHIVKFQHVPWDSYTLRPLSNIINELSDRNYRINIARTAAMSFVATPDLYDALQMAISNLYLRLPIEPPPIYFDYFAWNDNH